MISQEDIIRTFIKKSCTDEAVLSTALSPDCTTPKLLELLTELERFDLALDISVKLGLNVIPLWRTWAMRCLKSRDFRGAREKFRHCFPRFGTQRGPKSLVQSSLLNEILSELVKMQENQPSLEEEIELIKLGEYRVGGNDVNEGGCQIKFKPTILAECDYYLKEYGTIEDRIKFNMNNSLFDETVGELLRTHKKNIEKFFINEVFLHCVSIGKLPTLLEAFLKHDSRVLSESTRYFEAVYKYCLERDSRNYQQFDRYNILYYVQSTIKDHLAAAETQISFFLKRPMVTKCYKELNQRLDSLKKARSHYQEYVNTWTKNQGDSETSRFTCSFLNKQPRRYIVKKLWLVDTQVQLTHNFAASELCGCMNVAKLGPNRNENKIIDQLIDDWDRPVTLFDSNLKRIRFLVALVLIYFDPSCSSYFSKEGLKTAVELMRHFELERLKVFIEALHSVIEDESCDVIESASLLLERLKEDFLANRDEWIPSFIKTSIDLYKSGSGLRGNSRNFKEIDVGSICDYVVLDAIGVDGYRSELVKLLSDEAKIEYYLSCGNLSNAQLLACKLNRPDYVRKIIDLATGSRQNHVKTVCQLWLAKHETRNSIQ